MKELMDLIYSRIGPKGFWKERHKHNPMTNKTKTFFIWVPEKKK